MNTTDKSVSSEETSSTIQNNNVNSGLPSKPLDSSSSSSFVNNSLVNSSSQTNSNNNKNWVKFDDSPLNGDVENQDKPFQKLPSSPVLEAKQPDQQQQFATIDLSNNISAIQLNGSNKEPIKNQPTSSSKTSTEIANNSAPSRSGFNNGDIIVTLYPLNDHCAWITPATFKAHLVPEELMAQPLTLTVEDYVSTMSILLNDYRFHLYITLHKRILAIWITLSIVILLGILSSGTKGLSIFLSGILWLVLNALGIFLVIFIKNKLYRMLEESLSQVNAIFSRHNIFLGVDDRGHFSCHKINLIFIYFDSRYCIKFLQDMLKNNNDPTINKNSTTTTPGNNSTVLNILDDSDGNDHMSDIYITGSSGMKQISQKEKQAEKLLYRYSQRWIREFGRQRMSLSVINPQPSSSSTVPTTSNTSTMATTNSPSTDIPPRHCRHAKCFCQYIEELYRFKQQQRQQKSYIWDFCFGSSPFTWFR